LAANIDRSRQVEPIPRPYLAAVRVTAVTALDHRRFFWVTPTHMRAENALARRMATPVAFLKPTLNGNSPCIVNAVEQQRYPLFLDIFVDGFLRSRPVSIVIDYQNAAGNEPREQMDQFVFRGFVPIGVKAQQGNFIRRVRRQSIFDPASYEFHPVAGIAGRSEIAPDFIKW
jgi:hypothetical protein